MTHHDANIVKAALLFAGTSQADIARQCNVAPAIVSAVVHGRSRSKHIENRIAVTTGLPREQLWPDWYGPNAKRRKKPLSSAEVTRRLEAFLASHPQAAA